MSVRLQSLKIKIREMVNSDFLKKNKEIERIRNELVLLFEERKLSCLADRCWGLFLLIYKTHREENVAVVAVQWL